MLEQTLRSKGYDDESIAKIKLVMANPEATQYAMSTGNFDAAYEMVKPKEKLEAINLDYWFSSFNKDNPVDAKELSTQLTKFARYVQSATDKSKTPE